MHVRRPRQSSFKSLRARLRGLKLSAQIEVVDRGVSKEIIYGAPQKMGGLIGRKTTLVLVAKLFLTVPLRRHLGKQCAVDIIAFQAPIFTIFGLENNFCLRKFFLGHIHSPLIAATRRF